MFTFAIDYYLMIFIAATGVIQLACSFAALRGLLFTGSPLTTRVGAMTLICAPFIWFFTSTERNINDFEGGLDGNDQALFFFLGTLTSLVFTLVCTSIINRRMNNIDPHESPRLDALRTSSYFHSIRGATIYWKQRSPSRIKEYFSG